MCVDRTRCTMVKMTECIMDRWKMIAVMQLVGIFREVAVNRWVVGSNPTRGAKTSLGTKKSPFFGGLFVPSDFIFDLLNPDEYPTFTIFLADSTSFAPICKIGGSAISHN